MATRQKDALTTREKLQYGLIGLAVLGGAAVLVTRLVQKSRSNIEERRTMEEGTPATYAKQLKMAFENDGWPGTDEVAIRDTLRRMRSRQEFNEVVVSYQRLYNSNLLRDMKDELTTTEYNEMLAILSAKPDRYNAQGQMQSQLTPQQYLSWASRLKAAFDITYGMFPGTDEEAIRAVFLELPTQQAFQQLMAVYKATYGSDLDSALRSELEFWEYDPMMQIISNKPTT